MLAQRYIELYSVEDYQHWEGRYIKAGDFSDETFTFELDNCEIEFDFSTIWRVR